jgi:hypothetical protein
VTALSVNPSAQNFLATPHKNDRKKSNKQSARSKKTKQPESAPERTKHAAPRSIDAYKAAKPNALPEASLPVKHELTIYTIGHSTHPIDEFIALLKRYGIEQLVDVRTVPKSRHVPQFNSHELAAALGEQRIAYAHLKSLGGLRRAKKDSINTGWRNASFRGYADYMASDEFRQGIDSLIDLAKVKHTVIMCAEAVPWRCHRSLVGDALLVRGIAAEDIMGATSSRPHRLTEFAKVDGQQITYPPDNNLELFVEPPTQTQ